MKVKAKVIKYNEKQNRVMVMYDGVEYMDNTGEYDGCSPYFEIDIPVVEEIAEEKENENTES